MNRYWMMVFGAGFIEVAWVSGLKYAATPLEWIGTGLAIIVSFFILIIATNHLPIGTVYAVFTGLGTTGTVIAEIIIFHEPVLPLKLALIAMLLIGVIGLKIVTDRQKKEGDM
ncbi:DMT family transporter [Niallia nealsonii]|uniref:QacE family quaternary ammonium compound efflux SMR transporter n=1 Tax=Niallia nealsonii TaxID=115979 RepID=A0A2N0Z306_9BACI|nr:SMR family transporter [Niallia nealsonii]PKG23898.1 QacE family quaternary ammonium compound efflux SMR transporter [Niallia nealsonii]